MEKNLFLDVMKTLTDKNERKRLRDFIRSPYLNLSEKTDLQVKIVEAAWAWWDAGHTAFWDEQAVFAALFGPDEPFSQIKLDKLKSAVVGLAQRFFAAEARQKHQHPAEALRWEMQYYRDREQFHGYELTEKEARKELAKRRDSRSVEEYLQIYLLENEVAWLYPSENRRREEDYLMAAVEALDRFWLAARARWSCCLLNQNQRAALGTDGRERLFIQTLQQFKGYAPVDDTLVEAYRQAALLYAYSDDPLFLLEQFLTFIRGESQNLAPFIVDELETIAANFCVRQINMGKYQFLYNHFEILCVRLESKRLYRNGKILAADFHTIVNTALRLPREVVSTDWVKDFLDSHRSKLYNREAAEEMVRYNYANYYFHVGDFKSALKNLKETYRDLNFKISSKILEIKTLYELKKDEVDDRIEAAYAFFRRDPKIPDDKREALLPFINYLRRLRDPGLALHPERLEKIIRELEAGLFAERAWLLAKARELLPKPR